jgi:DNA-binding SARP family transcriptional activator
MRVSLEREAFDGFPYGLLVLDGGGRVLSCNRQAISLIDELGLGRVGLKCCDLLGCRRPDTALSTACLVELAIDAGSAVSEVRLDLETRTGTMAMWATASPIGSERSRVVLQLRPGLSADRHAWLRPSTATVSSLRISVLGGTAIDTAECGLGGAWLDQRTGQLLKYLVAERRRAVTVDEIGESIWPGADYAVAASVRYYVHALRRRLEPQRGSREPSAFILGSSGTYRLKLENVQVDVDEFEAHLRRGLAAVDRDPQAAEAEIERGMALYRGDFLADLPYADWAMPERHRLHELACVGLARLAELRLRRRAIAGAARSLERLAALQPYDEAVHRRLIELEIAQGRRSDAVRRYAALRSRIRRTFGHDLDFTPADLARPKL